MDLAIGRIVHYRFPESATIGGEPRGERPAIIVRVWGKTPESVVQLQVFLDTDEDGQHNDADAGVFGHKGALLWKTSVKHGIGKGEFHFHDECEER